MGEQRAPVETEGSEHGYRGDLEEKDYMQNKEDREACEGPVAS